MGKDKRPWRKLVKKLRRKRIRSEIAQKRDETEAKEARRHSRWNDFGGNNDDDMNSDSEDEELQLNRQVEEAKWLEREKESQLKFEMKKAEERKRIEIERLEKERIAKEWMELEAKRKAHEEEIKRLEEEKREKQEKEFNEFLDFLAGDIENPPLPFLMPEDVTGGEQAICPFFARTAACRFSVNCTRAHPRPTLSQIILIPNFFSHFALEQALLDEYDTDLNLEYEDSELYKAFLEFYDDVMPELKSIGEVIQFKVCCNLEPHLRGNVYVQYKDIKQAVEAYRLFNGRFYNGRQLSLQFVKIPLWRSAICGLFTRRRCPKKRSCYFLHVFRNPTKEFVSADNDWKELVRANSKYPLPGSGTPTSSRSLAISSPRNLNSVSVASRKETTAARESTERKRDSSYSCSSRTSRDHSRSHSRIRSRSRSRDRNRNRSQSKDKDTPRHGSPRRSINYHGDHRDRKRRRSDSGDRGRPKQPDPARPGANDDDSKKDCDKKNAQVKIQKRKKAEEGQA